MNHRRLVFVGALACMAFGLGALSAPLATVPVPGDSGRYQLVLASGSIQDGGLLVFRIDTATGKTWKFDTLSADLVTDEYLKEHGMERMDEEARKELEAKGMMLAIPPRWVELPEKAFGVTIRPFPSRK